MSEKVKVTNLVKTFGDNEVLKGINLTVQNNEVVVIIGPSGSGKSTLLRNLNKLEEPTSGSIVIDNVDIARNDVDINSVRENIGMVFQHFNLFKNLTVGENIMLAPIELKKETKEQAEAQAKKLLATVGLEEKIWCNRSIPIRWPAATGCHCPCLGNEPRYYVI